jgi:hypothetical protein
VWIAVGSWTIERLVVCDNPTFKELFKVEKD